MLWVMDFGIVVWVDVFSDNVEEYIGMLVYMVFEYIEWWENSECLDVFVVGLILFEMLVG